MKLAYALDALPKEKSEVALTIGTFDGVHKGHQQILTTLKQRGRPYVITFTSHPMQLLSQHSPLSITTMPHKLSLLEKEEVERCYLLDFNNEFSRQTAKEFLLLLKKKLNFTSLVLGHDARIGYQRHGDQECLRTIAKELQVAIEYIPPYFIDQQLVSSSLIREKIAHNFLEDASLFLGRKYSVYAAIVPGAGKGHALGYPTANIDTTGLVLPELGVWVCKVIHKGKTYKGVANLGKAPTFYDNRPCLLEIHLLDYPTNLYNEMIEVIFESHLRKEKRFENSADLRKQIALDIATAQSF